MHRAQSNQNKRPITLLLAEASVLIVLLLASIYSPPGWTRAASDAASRIAFRSMIGTAMVRDRLPVVSPSPRPTATPTCSPAWAFVPSPNLTENSTHLNSVSALASNDVWAVGDYGDPGNPVRTLTIHWDGIAWNVVPSPNVASAQTSILIGLAALSDNDMWAVGYYYDNIGEHTLALHWDGAAWSIVASPDVGTGTNWLTAVVALSANNVWAVGYYSTVNPYATLIEHWDGSQWSIVNSPNVGTGNNELWGICAISPDDIWAVGYSHANPGALPQPLTLHWDGNQWYVVPSPGSTTQEMYVYGVSAVSATNVWAVGSIGHSTLTIRWDGSQWNVVPSPSVGTDLNLLSGMTALSANDIWAVGYHCCSGPGPLAEHWDGSQWSIVYTPSPSAAGNYFYSVAGASAGDVWAVGYFVGPGGAARTLTEHYVSPCATPLPSPSSSPSGFTPTPTVATTPTHCPISFADVPPSSTFYPYIRCLACRGIISGYSSGCESGNPCFRPNNNVTRGQIAKIASNAAGFNDIPGPQQFEDVPPGSTFYGYIWRLADRGYISGYPCGMPPAGPCSPPANYPYFLTGSDVTRGQTTKIVSNTAGFSDHPVGQQFEDIPLDSTFYTYTYRLVIRSIMSGYPCGASPAGPCNPPANYPYFLPGSNATRGQSSKIVTNTFFPSCYTPEHPR